MNLLYFFFSDDMNEGSASTPMSVNNVTDPNDGRNRRKVMFRSDDMNFSDLDESDTQDDDDDDIKNIASAIEENDDSNSEWSDSEEETEDKKDETDRSRFYGRSFGKENEIRKKIANELAKLDKIVQESSNTNWNEQEQQDYSDDSMEYDQDSSDEDESDNEDLKADISDEEINNVVDEDKTISLGDKVLKNDFYETNEDTTLNWKRNLTQKATNAYYDRQNSVANLWKLVYGKYIYC